MSFSNTLKQVSIAISSTLLGCIGLSEAAGAFSLTPNTIVNTWSKLPEVKYNCPVTYCSDFNWAADNTRSKVPYDVLTNFPQRIGQSSSRDTERYGAIVSDFSSTGNFNFTGSLFMPNDNDIVGLLWGYQDPNNHYRFSWGSGRVKRPGLTDGPYERPDLLAGPNTGQPGSRGLSIVKEVNGVSTFLATNIPLQWQRSTQYDYRVNRAGNNLLVSILQGQQTLFSTTIADTTFMSGKIGFNTAGVETFYGNTQFTGVTSLASNTLGSLALSSNVAAAAPVPEPGILLGLFGLSLVLGKRFKPKCGDR